MTNYSNAQGRAPSARLRLSAATWGIAFCLCIPAYGQPDRNDRGNPSIADGPQLTAQWWQWVFSIPNPLNPIFDTNGDNCMIGQRGSIWFLAGAAGGVVTRQCSVPANRALFFPVINVAGYNSPNCGQGPENLTVQDLRQGTADVIATVNLADLRVDLDSTPVTGFAHIKSDVFSIALPVNNMAGCAAGIYSPAVDDGYYLKIGPLAAGPHTLRIRSTVSSPFFAPFDLTYNLVVVPVVDR